MLSRGHPNLFACRPQQDYPAATVVEYCSAVLTSPKTPSPHRVTEFNGSYHAILSVRAAARPISLSMRVPAIYPPTFPQKQQLNAAPI
jgi:hypothetical protein